MDPFSGILRKKEMGGGEPNPCRAEKDDEEGKKEIRRRLKEKKQTNVKESKELKKKETK